MHCIINLLYNLVLLSCVFMHTHPHHTHDIILSCLEINYLHFDFFYPLSVSVSIYKKEDIFLYSHSRVIYIGKFDKIYLSIICILFLPINPITNQCPL